MPANRSTDGDLDDLPLYIRRGFGKDRSWVDRAKCRNNENLPGFAWTIEVRDSRMMGKPPKRVTARALHRLALKECLLCPVQWECAKYAIDTDAVVGVWGARLEDLRWLACHSEWRDILVLAKEHAVPVQTIAQRSIVST
jgi:hypothetical protein